MRALLRSGSIVIMAVFLSFTAQAGDETDHASVLLDALECAVIATEAQMTPEDTFDTLKQKASDALATKCAAPLNAYSRSVEDQICRQNGWKTLRSWVVQEFRAHNRAAVSAFTAQYLTGQLGRVDQ